ncbi:MAG: DUF5828 family protein [Candidatus Saliniplasma sp.]
MSTKSIELTNSGVKLKGDWNQVCHFAEGFEEVIEEAEASDESVSRYKNWRPRKNESKKDIKKKTVDEAKVDPEKLENGGLAKKADEIASSNGQKSFKTKTSKAMKELYIGSARLVSMVEEIIYGKMMLQLNPYFFDNEDFSANLELKNQDNCELNFHFSDEKMRDRVKNIVKESTHN